MSSVYSTEPPTEGKVILHTSYGDVDVELWPHEAPKTCRNFVQLALEGYYDGTTFHRVIPQFMVQGGDPTGTGKGGESVWGKPFRDEIHGRLRFRHRGLLAMANENTPHTNSSQFFLTLDACGWLDGKHTIFGKVTGNTIFNLLRMGEVEVDDGDVPLEPLDLKTIEVLVNPFDDVVPRARPSAAGAADGGAAGADAAGGEWARRKKARKAKKDFKLLSFGEEALEEEAQLAAAPKAMVSSHDAADGGALLRPDVAPELSEIAAARAAADDDARDADARGWVQALVDDDDDAPPRAARSAPAAPAWF